MNYEYSIIPLMATGNLFLLPGEAKKILGPYFSIESLRSGFLLKNLWQLPDV